MFLLKKMCCCNCNDYSEIQNSRIVGLSVFFDKDIKTIEFERYVELPEARNVASRKWFVFIVDSQRMRVNAEKVAIVLERTIKEAKKIKKKALVTEIQTSSIAERTNLVRSVKDPSLIDQNTKNFASTLFDEESNSQYQICDLRFFGGEPLLRFIAVRLNDKFRILCFERIEEISVGGFSTIIKVVDVTKNIWGVLKIATNKNQSANECNLLLYNEEKAFDICYGLGSPEGTQRLGWEKRPSPFFQLPLSIIEYGKNSLTGCLIKPFYPELDLLDFIKHNKVSFEQIICGCWQLIQGLKRFAELDIWLLDISAENIWGDRQKSFNLRLCDFGSLNSKQNLLKEIQKGQFSFKIYRKTTYLTYEEDKLLIKLEKRIKEKNKNVKESVERFCEVAKKIDVFALGACLYMLINQSLKLPYSLITTSKNYQYAGTVTLSFNQNFNFLRPLFLKILAKPNERISASELTDEFFEAVNRHYPAIATSFKNEIF